MIYLASPYTHPDPAIRKERFQAVCAYAATMMRSGLRVFSPIAHTHHIALCGLPGGWEFWEAYDRDMIARCDEDADLCPPCAIKGWEERLRGALACLPGVVTLATRNSDSLDFHDLGVGCIRDALIAAYRAGATKERDTQ